MKMLLYCTKAKPYLIHESGCYDSDDMCCDYDCFSVVDRQELYNQDISLDKTYNGKIVAECDFEVKEIGVYDHKPYDEFGNWYFQRGHKHNNEYDIAEDFESLLNDSCLNAFELNDYLGGYDGYAIHIKNLNIFYTPKELSEYCKYNRPVFDKNDVVEKAPQNMCRVLTKNGYEYILISIKPEWLCKILNGEKTIEVRKKVLKEMTR